MSDTGRQVLDRPVRVAAGDRPVRARDRLRFPTRLDMTAAVVGLMAVSAMIPAVVAEHSSGTGPAPSTESPRPTAAVASANAVPAIIGRGPSGSPKNSASLKNSGSPKNSGLRKSSGLPTGAPARRAAVPLVLTDADHQNCPAEATACVDLTRHITWLQAGQRVTFGPVQMEPGKPGGEHQTPLGTFQVEWKAGPSYQSNTYHEPMPWATFFAAGGIAFHGGSLTEWSHGCVHLTVTDAHYYNTHLPIGAEVVVF
jgi:hypothetical protein